METTTGEGLSEILNGVSILPPRPEDAGLEDCALPPDSIMEAFSRAAAAKFLSAGSDDDDGDDCVQDPGPSHGPTHDALVVGGTTVVPTTEPFCGANDERGGCGGRDEVVVVGAGDDGVDPAADLVVGGTDEGEEEEQRVGGKRWCVVDGGEGLGEEKKKGQHKEDSYDEYDDEAHCSENWSVMSSPIHIARPEGKKTKKLARKRKGKDPTNVESAESSSYVLSQIFEWMKERREKRDIIKARKQRKREDAIMTMDLTGFSSVQQQYFKMRRVEILERWKSM